MGSRPALNFRITQVFALAWPKPAISIVVRLDGNAGACQSRRVKSCGPSGSQDLAFCGPAS
jgi:hypothetical protein